LASEACLEPHIEVNRQQVLIFVKHEFVPWVQKGTPIPRWPPRPLPTTLASVGRDAAVAERFGSPKFHPMWQTIRPSQSWHRLWRVACIRFARCRMAVPLSPPSSQIHRKDGQTKRSTEEEQSILT